MENVETVSFITSVNYCYTCDCCRFMAKTESDVFSDPTILHSNANINMHTFKSYRTIRTVEE